MKLTRRNFLSAIPAVAAVVFFGGRGANAQTPEPDPLSLLTWNSFGQCLNSNFAFQNGGSSVSLKLTDMEDTSGGGTGECFVLKFKGQANRPLYQETFNVSHNRLGNFRLFITPGVRQQNTLSYFAVINRQTA